MNEKEKRAFLLALSEAKKRGSSLSGVFAKTAEKTGFARGSVRNYYYRVVAKEKPEQFCVKTRESFSKEDEIALIRKILNERLNCSSTRQAVLRAAGGDEKLAARYQNKFASMVKKQKAVVMREVLQQKQKTGKCFNPFTERAQKSKNEKLRKEIDCLIKRIRAKCAKENAQLKRKIEEYERGKAVNYFSSGAVAFLDKAK